MFNAAIDYSYRFIWQWYLFKLQVSVYAGLLHLDKSPLQSAQKQNIK